MAITNPNCGFTDEFFQILMKKLNRVRVEKEQPFHISQKDTIRILLYPLHYTSLHFTLLHCTALYSTAGNNLNNHHSFVAALFYMNDTHDSSY